MSITNTNHLNKEMFLSAKITHTSLFTHLFDKRKLYIQKTFIYKRTFQ